jgi:hypothetical protein
MAMTAILDVDILRAHSVSVISPWGLVPSGFGNASDPDWDHRPPRRRPVLLMRWQVASDGRPRCAWQAQISGT